MNIMKLGILNDIFKMETVNTIKIASNRDEHKLTVVSAEFEPSNRRTVFLQATQYPPVRTNRTKAIIAYLLDFNDTHTVYVVHKDKEDRILPLSSEYSVDKEQHTLLLHADN